MGSNKIFQNEENETTVVQIKVSRSVNNMFLGFAKVMGKSKDKAHEESMKLYIEHCHKNFSPIVNENPDK